MTHLVLRSSIKDEKTFARDVDTHAEELRNYKLHYAAVLRGEADLYPPPSASADVAKAVSRPDFMPDYKIVDRLPVQHGDIAALTQCKNELQQQINIMELAAVHALLPPGKWRLAGIEYGLALSKPPEEQSTQEKAIVAAHGSRLRTLDAIKLHHAQLESQIEDLTFDTVNDWVPTPFKG
jgi:hypothetical protein